MTIIMDMGDENKLIWYQASSNEKTTIMKRQDNENKESIET